MPSDFEWNWISIFVLSILTCIGTGLFWIYLSRNKYKSIQHSFGLDKTILKQGFSMKKIPSNLDTIIIGSGLGGLSTASILAKAGEKVLVLEQHDTAGGNTHTFEENGFEFDTGLHYIGDNIGNKNSPSRKLMDYITDGGVEWEKMDEIYDLAVMKNQGERESIPMHSSMKTIQKNLIQKFPTEEQAIKKYFRIVRQANRMFYVSTLIRMLPRFLENLFNSLFHSYLNKWSSQTMMEVLSSLTKNQKLIGILTYFYGDLGEAPSRGSFLNLAVLQAHWNNGAFYPIYGPSIISQRIIQVIEKYHGKVLVRAPVSSILINEKNQAYGILVKGHEIYAKTIISSAGACNTYMKLIDSKYHSLINPLIKHLQDPEIQSVCTLMSMFVGIHGTTEEFNLPKRNLWIFPSWNHDENCLKYQKNPKESFPGIFISFSSAKDPKYKKRYPNKQTALVIVPEFYEHFEKYKDLRVKHRGKEYNDMKKCLQERLILYLIEEFPQLKDHIQYCDLGTPVTNDFYLGNYRGAVYGISHTPKRFLNPLSPQTPISNLYLTGQDILSGGIIGALSSSLICTSAISKRILIQSLIKMA